MLITTCRPPPCATTGPAPAAVSTIRAIWIVDDIDEGILKEAEANLDVDLLGGDTAAISVRSFAGKLKATDWLFTI